MAIVKWAAIGVTALMGLANLGQLGQDLDVGWKILGVVLAVGAAVAVVGFLTRKSWGLTAVIAVGVANVLGAIGGAVAGVDGWPIGLVLAALGPVLAAVYVPTSRAEASA